MRCNKTVVGAKVGQTINRSDTIPCICMVHVKDQNIPPWVIYKHVRQSSSLDWALPELVVVGETGKPGMAWKGQSSTG